MAANPVPRGMTTRRTGAGDRATGSPLIRTPRTLPRVLDPAEVIGLLLIEVTGQQGDSQA